MAIYSGSYPLNTLDKFVSYSYHNYLLAAADTETLKAISESKNLYSLIASKPGNSLINIGDNTGTNVVMVLNSTTDSKYTIDGIDYTTLFGGDSGDNNIITGKLTMQIKEPTGINFMNYIDELSTDVLKTGMTNIMFFLKTVFVGHLSNGQTETIQLDPITMVMHNISSSFDHSGGVYDLEFLPISNGSVLRSTMTRYVNKKTNIISSDGTLWQGLKSFEKSLNKELDLSYISFQENYLKATNSPNKTYSNKDFGNESSVGKKVNYLITIPEDWKKYTIDTGNTANIVEPFFKAEEGRLKTAENKRKEEAAKEEATKKKGNTRKTNTNKPAKSKDSPKNTEGERTVGVNAKLTVTAVLKKIVQKCPQIFTEAEYNKQSKDKQQHSSKKLYKILTNVTSDKNNLVIHYDVVEYFLPKKPKDDKESKKLDGKPEVFNQNKFTPRHGLILDYLFTGKNSQIKNLDIKFTEGNVYFNRNLFGGQKVETTAKPGKATEKNFDASTGENRTTKESGKAETIFRLRLNDPIYAAATTEEEIRGYLDKENPTIEKQQEHESNLINFYKSFMNATLKIRGNPRLMGQTIAPIMPINTTEYQKIIVQQAQDTKDRIAGKKDNETVSEIENGKIAMASGEDQQRSPGFIKINILSPSEEGDAFAQPNPFWYDGWWWIYSISNTFSGGEFEQELQLKAYGIYGIDTSK